MLLFINKENSFYTLYILSHVNYLIFVNIYSVIKRSWKERAESRVIKRLKVKERQDYILKRVHKLLEPKCRLNCNKSNNSNLSISIDSEEEENLQLNELIDLKHHSQKDRCVKNGDIEAR